MGRGSPGQASVAEIQFLSVDWSWKVEKAFLKFLLFVFQIGLDTFWAGSNGDLGENKTERDRDGCMEVPDLWQSYSVPPGSPQSSSSGTKPSPQRSSSIPHKKRGPTGLPLERGLQPFRPRQRWLPDHHDTVRREPHQPPSPGGKEMRRF